MNNARSRVSQCFPSPRLLHNGAPADPLDNSVGLRNRKRKSWLLEMLHQLDRDPVEMAAIL